MIFEPSMFYKTYLVDFHKFKADLYKKVLSEQPRYEIDIFGQELEVGDKDAFRRTLKADLRQTYFHAIESFFEIFFALDPTGKRGLNDENILFELSNSKWQANYDRIKRIAQDNYELDFLDKEITLDGKG